VNGHLQRTVEGARALEKNDASCNNG
jgi:hypothetical protein